MPLFLLFIILPIIELSVILKFHGSLSQVFGGFNSTLISMSLIIGTGIVGAKFAKSQGRKILMDIQESLAKGEIPGEALQRGLLVLLGGAMLLTPGYVTDTVGLLFILPITQSWFTSSIKKYFGKLQSQGKVNFMFGMSNSTNRGANNFRTQHFSSQFRPNMDQQSNQKQFFYERSVSNRQPTRDKDIIDLEPSDWSENKKS